MKFYIFVEVRLKIFLYDACEKWASCHLCSFLHYVNDLLSDYKSMKHQATGRRKFEVQVIRKHGYAITSTIKNVFVVFGILIQRPLFILGMS